MSSIDPRVDIGHVHLKVADIDRSLAFWGATCSARRDAAHGDQAAFISAGRLPPSPRAQHVESKGGTAPPRGSTGSTTSRFAIPDRKSLADALRRLVQAGIPLDGASDHGVSEALYLRDPDNNGVELYRDPAPRRSGPARRTAGSR